MKLPIFDASKIAVYIHWPFCESKCPYCDFNSHVSLSSVNQKQWLQGYLNAFDMQKKYFHNKSVKSIFFGGGTPSLMSPETINDIINYFKEHNKMLAINLPITEITLESNPSTFEVSKFQDFFDAGVSRLSTGVQSFNAKNLQYLGRKHSVSEAIYALEKSYEIFTNTSFDLIMGLPQQSLQDLQDDLNIALKYVKNHISIYQLTIEEGTLFHKQKVKELDDDLGEVFYQEILNHLESIGMKRYEISNFAKIGCESIHNLNYWQGGEYIGIGPNASGRVFAQNWLGTREYKSPNVWLNKALQHEDLLVESTTITNNERFEELVMTSLRLDKDIETYIVDLLPKDKIQKLLNENLLEYSNSTNLLKTTNKGKMCLNYVIQELLA